MKSVETITTPRPEPPAYYHVNDPIKVDLNGLPGWWLSETDFRKLMANITAMKGYIEELEAAPFWEP